MVIRLFGCVLPTVQEPLRVAARSPSLLPPQLLASGRHTLDTQCLLMSVVWAGTRQEGKTEQDP